MTLTSPTATGRRAHAAQLALLGAAQTLVAAHAAPLTEAARYTAGPRGADLARRLCADIAAVEHWQPAFARRLRLLRGLLALDHAGDPEAFYPVPDDLCDPDPERVLTCCLYVERLTDLIERAERVATRRHPRARAQDTSPAAAA